MGGTARMGTHQAMTGWKGRCCVPVSSAKSHCLGCTSTVLFIDTQNFHVHPPRIAILFLNVHIVCWPPV